MCLEDAIAHLGKESKRLAQDQGRIARRNGRWSVFGALRQVRNALNEEFPQIIKIQTDTDKLFVIEVFIRPDKWSKGKGRWRGLWSPPSSLSYLIVYLGKTGR